MPVSENRKELRALAALNLKGQGILIKKIPATLFAKCEAEPVVDAFRNTCQRMTQLGWMTNVSTWGRGGLEGGYLEEIVRGITYVKHPNIVVALKHQRGANSPTQIVGMAVYGTFSPGREAVIDNTRQKWDIRINGMGDNAAEIEAIITKNSDAGLGVGTALLEYAIADIAARMSRGQPRYTDVILFSSDQRMRTIAGRYGLAQKAQRYMQDGQNRTTQLVNGEFADDPAVSKVMHAKLNDAGINRARNQARNRITSTNACPTKGGALKMWQLCR